VSPWPGGATGATIRAVKLTAEKSPGALVMIADADDAFRELLAVVLAGSDEIGEVVAAGSGSEAIQLGLQLHPQFALFDLDVPGLDAIAAAVVLREIEPSLEIALHCADRRRLAERAGGLGLPLFAKHDLDHMIGWAEARASARHAAKARFAAAKWAGPDSAQTRRGL
jgi:CheY-like chemotaxis protein